jgi:hypothetical protein
VQPASSSVRTTAMRGLAALSNDGEA